MNKKIKFRIITLKKIAVDQFQIHLEKIIKVVIVVEMIKN